MANVSNLSRAIKHDPAAKIVFYRSPSIFSTMALVAEYLDDNAGHSAGVAQNNRQVRRQVKRRAEGDGWAFGPFRTLAAWTEGMTNGDPTGAERVEKCAAEIAPSVAAPVGAKRTVRRGQQGDELCIHRVYAGSMRPWTFRARDLGRAPSPVTILVPMTSNAHASAESFGWRAAAALALAGPLMRSGYRCNIVAVDSTASTFENSPAALFVAHDIQVGASLDIPRLSACLSAPHLRHLTFAIAAASPLAVNSGLGYAVQRPEEIARLAAAAGVIRPGADVVIVGASIESEREAREWIKAESARFAPEGQQ